jgi:hypothetical protein
MTPADEATFIARWQQGLAQDAMAHRLGIPRGSVSSRASTLVRQGKIQPRPQGWGPSEAAGQGPAGRQRSVSPLPLPAEGGNQSA